MNQTTPKDLSLKEHKLNEKEILKILTEVAVTRSEAEIVSSFFETRICVVADF